MSAKFPLFSQVVLAQDLPKYDLKRGSVAISTIVGHYPMPNPEEDCYSFFFYISKTCLDVNFNSGKSEDFISCSPVNSETS
jgi:hypothetical protein